ncbi:ABC transporter permease [Kistimonas scapharcae]|uniref:ABC transporter permease n=1 Tax=Kistimonas scapharcae TaxID=1036133 RepID=A0ABP8V1Y4_9GAMM
MSNAATIPFTQLIAFYGLLIIPFAMLWQLKLGDTIRKFSVSLLRMTFQLGLIALYLEFLFRFNHLWINLGWLLVMLIVASSLIVKQAGLSRRHLFSASLIALLVASSIVLTAMLLLVKPTPWYDARYLVPLAGMLLGNCLTANILTLERFYQSIDSQYDRYMNDLLLGASQWEAALPFIREALKAALNPMIATTATLGIVYLPGMMTGQILGGTDPITAVAYQVMIMAGIAISTVVSTVLILILSLKAGFDGFGLLNQNLLINQQTTY